jgi:hypothetical protein
MLNNLDRDQHKALPRQRQIQASASRKECALLKKLLHISARHCPDSSSPVGQLRNERFMATEEPAFMPKNLPTSPSSLVEGQLFPLSTRSSNSK